MNDHADDPPGSTVRTVRVPMAARPYDVIIGHGVRSQVASLLPVDARRAAIVTQEGIPFDIDPGVAHEVFTIGEGEGHKSLATIGTLCEGFAAMGLTRNDVIIGVGGGMVTDIAGFAAAAWHRGVPVVHVSTTLLGMIDAAIGGKTGVNLVAGKNLVGAFWQPSGVICDLDALATLAPREMRCGLGEMAKYHFLGGDDLLSIDLVERIARCVAIKAEIVAADEREGGRRALLNYGHTLAHAVEIASDFTLAHGEAVAIGLIYAAHLARVLGRIDDRRVGEHYDVVGGRYGLQTSLPELDHQQLLLLMGRDKKAVAGLTFVLDSANGVEVVPDVPTAAAREALHEMALLARP
ncbi:MAG: 3-dehydroquinate synthase family protein [Ilumatobacteraceae bacterium]